MDAEYTTPAVFNDVLGIIVDSPEAPILPNRQIGRLMCTCSVESGTKWLGAASRIAEIIWTCVLAGNASIADNDHFGLVTREECDPKRDLGLISSRDFPRDVRIFRSGSQCCEGGGIDAFRSECLDTCVREVDLIGTCIAFQMKRCSDMTQMPTLHVTTCPDDFYVLPKLSDEPRTTGWTDRMDGSNGAQLKEEEEDDAIRSTDILHLEQRRAQGHRAQGHRAQGHGAQRHGAQRHGAQGHGAQGHRLGSSWLGRSQWVRRAQNKWMDTCMAFQMKQCSGMTQMPPLHVSICPDDFYVLPNLSDGHHVDSRCLRNDVTQLVVNWHRGFHQSPSTRATRITTDSRFSGVTTSSLSSTIRPSFGQIPKSQCVRKVENRPKEPDYQGDADAFVHSQSAHSINLATMGIQGICLEGDPENDERQRPDSFSRFGDSAQSCCLPRTDSLDNVELFEALVRNESISSGNDNYSEFARDSPRHRMSSSRIHLKSTRPPALELFSKRLLLGRRIGAPQKRASCLTSNRPKLRHEPVKPKQQPSNKCVNRMPRVSGSPQPTRPAEPPSPLDSLTSSDLIDAMLRPFLPQLQFTCIKALQDQTSRPVRLAAGEKSILTGIIIKILNNIFNFPFSRRRFAENLATNPTSQISMHNHQPPQRSHPPILMRIPPPSYPKMPTGSADVLTSDDQGNESTQRVVIMRSPTHPHTGPVFMITQQPLGGPFVTPVPMRLPRWTSSPTGNTMIYPAQSPPSQPPHTIRISQEGSMFPTFDYSGGMIWGPGTMLRESGADAEQLLAKRNKILKRLQPSKDDDDPENGGFGHVSYTVALSVLDDRMDHHPIARIPVDPIPMASEETVTMIGEIVQDRPRAPSLTTAQTATILMTAASAQASATVIPIVQSERTGIVPQLFLLEVPVVPVVPMVPAETFNPSVLLPPQPGQPMLVDSATGLLTPIQLILVAHLPNVVSNSLDKIFDVKERLSEANGCASEAENGHLRMELRMAESEMAHLTKNNCLLRNLHKSIKSSNSFKSNRLVNHSNWLYLFCNLSGADAQVRLPASLEGRLEHRRDEHLGRRRSAENLATNPSSQSSSPLTNVSIECRGGLALYSRLGLPNRLLRRIHAFRSGRRMLMAPRRLVRPSKRCRSGSSVRRGTWQSISQKEFLSVLPVVKKAIKVVVAGAKGQQIPGFAHVTLSLQPLVVMLRENILQGRIELKAPKAHVVHITTDLCAWRSITGQREASDHRSAEQVAQQGRRDAPPIPATAPVHVHQGPSGSAVPHGSSLAAGGALARLLKLHCKPVAAMTKLLKLLVTSPDQQLIESSLATARAHRSMCSKNVA